MPTGNQFMTNNKSGFNLSTTEQINKQLNKTINTLLENQTIIVIFHQINLSIKIINIMSIIVTHPTSKIILTTK
jgi:hypothetical protein